MLPVGMSSLNSLTMKLSITILFGVANVTLHGSSNQLWIISWHINQALTISFHHITSTYCTSSMRFVAGEDKTQASLKIKMNGGR